MLDWCDRQINRNKAIRRIMLTVILGLVCLTVWRATDPEVLMAASTAGGVIVTAIIGLLTLPIQRYFRDRADDDKR